MSLFSYKSSELHPDCLRKRVNLKAPGPKLVELGLQATRQLATETDDRSILLFFVMLVLGQHPKGTPAVPRFTALFRELGLNECAETVEKGQYRASDLAFFWSSERDFSRLFESSNVLPVSTFSTSEQPRPLPKTIMQEQWGECPFFEFDSMKDPVPVKNWKLFQIPDATYIWDTTEFAVLDSELRPIIPLCSRFYQHVFFTPSFGKSLDRLFPSFPSEVHAEDEIAAALIIQDLVPEPNYCHWLLDQLPRMRQLSDDDRLIIHSRAPYIDETLTTFGVDLDRVIELGRSAILHVKRLTIDTSMARNYCHPLQEVNAELVDYVKSGFSDALQAASEASGGRRIYVSRNRSKRRIITNESALLDCLDRHGFETVYLEEHSMAEQIALFNNASIIVAPHGAGLANVMFCQDAAVIEIFNPNYGTFSFRLLAQLCGLQYQHVMGTDAVLSAEERQNAGRFKLQQGNIEVDIQAVEQCLSKVIL